jgi:colanic acid biosynthesis glycosyl transferase WcaI
MTNTRLRILVYSGNFAPELTGIGKYTGEMAAWLSEAEHEVRVVTSPPYYPDWHLPRKYVGVRWVSEKWQKIDVLRCPLWVPSKPGGLKRILHLASFALSSFFPVISLARWRPNVVWVVQPTLFCAPAAALVAASSGAKSWLHIQDFEVDAAFDIGLVKGSLLRRWVSTGERWLMRRFDRVSTISGRMMDRARAKAVPNYKCRFFPNWVDISSIKPAPASSYRGELSIEAGLPVALYSGNMGNKQGLEILAAVAAQRPEVTFVFCGDGSGKEDLVRRCEGLTNVRFLPLQPLERLSDLLALADVHLLPQRADAADLVMPSKLTGMLASGRCVVATAAPHTELAQVVSDKANCGLVVPPEDPDAMAAAIAKLAADPELRARLGANGRAYAEANLDRDAVLRRFEQDLLELVGEK